MRNGDPVRASVALRISAGAMMVGAVVWLAAAVVLAVRPSGPIIDRVHSMLIPAAMVALLIGSVGLNAWLGGFRPRGGGPSGLASALEAMSSRRHRAVEGPGFGDGEDRSTARSLGLGALWLGAVGVIVGSQLVAGGPAMRSTLLFSWILFFGGTMILGVTVISAADPPPWAGRLLTIGSLLVLVLVSTYLFGGARRHEFIGPLLGADGPMRVLALALWSALGAGWAWLGGALWLRIRSRDEAAGSDP